MEKTKETKNMIWASLGVADGYTEEGWLEDCELNDVSPEEYPFDDWCAESNELALDDEKMNLDTCVDGVIIALVDMGLWNGRRNNVCVMDSNIADSIFGIADRFRSIDEAEFYGDGENIIGKLYHHDGTHKVVFRIFKGWESEADEMLEEAESFDEIMDKTESLYKSVADIYGWS